MKHFFNSSFGWIFKSAFLFSISFFFLSCTNNSNPAGNAGGSLSDPSIKPTVIFTLPANGAVGPFEIYNPGDGSNKPSFVIQFNKLMSTYSFKTGSMTCSGFDRPVVVRLHQVYYPLPENVNRSQSGISKVPSKNITLSNRDVEQINSDYDDVLEFDIRDSMTGAQMPYAVGKTYTVRIDTSLKDINGNYLIAPYTFSFTPEPSFRVVGSYPANGQSGVSPIGPYISVTFNSPLSPGSLSQIQISPPASGSWTLSSDSTSTSFKLAGNILSYDTTYSVRIPTSVSDRYGHHLTHDFMVNFTTAAFQVSYVNPSNGATNVYPNSSIYFNFTGQIDQNTVPSSFTITPNVQGSFNYSGLGFFSFAPANGFAFNTKYTVTLSTELKTSDGTALASPYITTFTTAPFQVTSTYPTDGATNLWPVNLSNINVYFTGAIDSGSAKSAFSIDPNVQGYITLSYYSTSTSAFWFVPYNGFKTSTTYTVTISTSMKSRNGIQFASPYSFSFSTAPFQVTGVTPTVYDPGNSVMSINSSVNVYCDAAIDTSTVRSAFSISPNANGTFTYYRITEGYNYFHFNPDSQLAANTSYTVTISKSLKAFDGTSLSQSYSATLATGPY